MEMKDFVLMAALVALGVLGFFALRGHYQTDDDDGDDLSLRWSCDAACRVSVGRKRLCPTDHTTEEARTKEDAQKQARRVYRSKNPVYSKAGVDAWCTR